MKVGFLTDLTADLKADPNFASVAKANVDITPDEQKMGGIYATFEQNNRVRHGGGSRRVRNAPHSGGRR
jgi:hypothetical protein